jgi:hypothetical protein
VATKPTRTTFSARQVRFAYKYAYGRTIKEAATLAGIHRATAHAWLEDPHYRYYVDTVRDTVMDGQLSRLVGLADKSIRVQSGLMDSESEDMRLNASKAAQDFFFRYLSAAAVNRRLSALELAKLAGEAPGVDDGAAEARNAELIRTWLGVDGTGAPSENGDGHE